MRTECESSPVLLERRDGVAILTLNRPESANAIDLAMTAALGGAVGQLAQEGWARAVVLRSRGRLFSAGGDVRAFRQSLQAGGPDKLAAFVKDLVDDLHRAQLALLDLGVPVIAAVDGVAAGAGMSLVLAADLAYVSPRARFVPAYPGIGFSADGGLSWFLPRAVGSKRAAEILLLNETLSAEQAAAEGLVTALIADEGEAFDAAVLARAAAVAAGPRRALGDVRRLLRQGVAASLEDQLIQEARSMTALAATLDVAEGLAALAAKRPPAFYD